MSSNRELDGMAERTARLDAVVPAATSVRLGPVLTRTMRRLPDPILVALARGLRAHRDELAPGRLFASPRAGRAPSSRTSRRWRDEVSAGGRAMRDPAAALQVVVVAVVVVGVIGALWSAIGFGDLYERIGKQLFLSRRAAARRPARPRRVR